MQIGAPQSLKTRCVRRPPIRPPLNPADPMQTMRRRHQRRRDADEGPVHRPLIRAQLPRPEGIKTSARRPSSRSARTTRAAATAASACAAAAATVRRQRRPLADADRGVAAGRRRRGGTSQGSARPRRRRSAAADGAAAAVPAAAALAASRRIPVAGPGILGGRVPKPRRVRPAPRQPASGSSLAAPAKLVTFLRCLL